MPSPRGEHSCHAGCPCQSPAAREERCPECDGLGSVPHRASSSPVSVDRDRDELVKAVRRELVSALSAHDANIDGDFMEFMARAALRAIEGADQ